MEDFISVACFITIMAAVFVINCNAEVLKSNGTAGENLDAQTLVSYGREFNNSLITIIGRVIENYHVCTAWSEWSECGTTIADQYSTRTRSRRCGEKKARYDYRSEIETGVCEGIDRNKTKSCPNSYQTTSNGFCLKLYMEKKILKEAQDVCKNDGGFLIHIDSDKKYDNVKVLLSANSVTSDIYIDGKYVNSKWTFSYGSTTAIFQWWPTYPRIVPKNAWLRLSGKAYAGDQYYTYNTYGTTDKLIFICEIQLYN